MVLVAVCPSALVDVTVKLCTPSVFVLSAAPLATLPTHEAIPGPPDASWQLKCAATTLPLMTCSTPPGLDPPGAPPVTLFPPREIASDLVVTEAAVKQHLLRLYVKFRIPEGANRRTRLANEVIELGLVRPLAEHGSGQVQHAHGMPQQPPLDGVQRPAEGRQAGHQVRDR